MSKRDEIAALIVRRALPYLKGLYMIHGPAEGVVHLHLSAPRGEAPRTLTITITETTDRS